MNSKLRSLLTFSAVFAVCIAAAVLFPQNAEAATSGNYTYTVTNGKATITDFDTGVTGELIIPSTLGGYPVTAISSQAFSYCRSLTSVTIPDGVTSIGSHAFEYCSSLTSITIPDGVTSIGERAFQYCSSLTSVTIPDSVTSIGYYAFYNCSGLTSVTIPDSVTSIGNYAFYYCRGLTSITIPDSVTSIGSDAFAFCSGLTNVTIGNGVTSISSYAFYGCSSLTSVTIPDSVTSIGVSAFAYCSSLTSITISSGNTVYRDIDGVLFTIDGKTLMQYPAGKAGTSYVIPDGVTSIGIGAFEGCSGLTSVTLGNGVTSIGSDAFYVCSSLTSVTIPDSVTSIGSDAFYGCSSLTSVTIPDGVTSIGEYAFYNCSGLTSVSIGNGVTSIGEYVFRGCSSLTGVTIPNGVTSIGSYAFYGCSSLTSVTIPDSVTSIGERAFYNCSGLTSVSIGNGVTSIGSYAFYGCSGLTSVTLGNGVTSIGKGAFSGCSSLESITLPFVGGSVKASTDTYQYPFGYIFGTSSYTGGTATKQYYYGSSTSSTTSNTYYIPSTLRSVTITGGNILYGAFYNCSRLTSITIPDSVTGIGEYAFSGCSGVTSVSIPDSVTSIGDYAFNGCTSLANVYYWGTSAQWSEITIGSNNDPLLNATMTIFGDGEVTNGDFSITYTDSGFTINSYVGTATEVDIPSEFFGKPVTAIGAEAFIDQNKITSITIPDTVKTIGSDAFANCWELESIVIPDSVTSLGGYAFAGCENLSSVTLSKNLTEIGERAFYGCEMLESIVVYEGVTSIGASAFRNCGMLEEITLPYSLTSVGNYAFRGCDGLTTVNYGGTEEDWQKVTIGSYNDALEDAILKAHSHSWDEGKVAKKANCSEEGEMLYTCTTCNIGTKTEAIAVNDEHSYGKGTLTTAPTSDKDGVITYTCLLCQDTKTEAVKLEDFETYIIVANDEWTIATHFELTENTYSWINTSSSALAGLTGYSSGGISYLAPDGMMVAVKEADIEAYASGSLADEDIVYIEQDDTNGEWVGTEVIIDLNDEGNVEIWAPSGKSVVGRLTITKEGDTFTVKIGDKTYLSNVSAGTKMTEKAYDSTSASGFYISSATKKAVFNYQSAENFDLQLCFGNDERDVTEVGLFYDEFYNINYEGYVDGYDWNGDGEIDLVVVNRPQTGKVTADSNGTSVAFGVVGDNHSYCGCGSWHTQTTVTSDLTVLKNDIVFVYEDYKTGAYTVIKPEVIKGTLNNVDIETGEVFIDGVAYTLNNDGDLPYVNSKPVTQYETAQQSAIWHAAVGDSVSICADGLGNIIWALPTAVGSGDAVSGVALDKSELELGYIGSTAKLTATVSPSTAETKALKWRSSDTKVVTVDANGTVKVVGSGSATITVTTVDGSFSASCKVTSIASVGEIITGYTLTMQSGSGGDVGVNLKMTLSDELLSDSDAYVKLVINGKESTVPLTALKYDEVSGKYSLTTQVAAKNMTDIISATVYNGEGESGATYEYSVQSYAEYIIEHSSEYDAELVSMVKAMLNYGAAAQKYFGYNAEKLANSALTESEGQGAIDAVTSIEGVTAATYSGTPESVGIAKHSASIVLDSEIVIKHYITLAEGKSIENYIIQVNGATTAPIAEGSRYYVAVKNIEAADLDTGYTLSITTNDGAATYSATYSAMNYVEAMYNACKDNTQYADLCDLLKSIYLYNSAANTYFGK